MPVFPVRNLSKYGILNDVDPYSLPTEAFSAGVNVRFKNGSVLRAPVFRTASNSLANTGPRFVTANTPTAGYDAIIMGFLNGRVTSWKSGTETDVSITGYANADSEVPFTSCHLADVMYVNRGDRVPWFLRTTDTIFQSLALGGAGDWPSTYKARLLRSCGSALIALGITKGSTEYTTMVKTSEFTQFGTVPANWDPTIPGTNATENILADMEGRITDANNLGEAMIIYGINETWTMVADGSTNVWTYRRIFNDAGSINANCSVEVDRKHYVFGLTDIWVHDGNSKKSICDQRTRDFIFEALNVSKANRCFVRHNQELKEIYFCFVSGDAYTGFPNEGTDGCNRAAVYNYVDNIWTYYDLPYVYGGYRANVSTLVTYTTVTSTYEIGGSYLDQDDSIKKTFVFLGDADSAHSLTKSLYAFDLQGPGSSVAFPIDTNATKGWTLIREGIDLDELGADLKGYKVINSIYPQARLEPGAQPINFYVGATDYSNIPVVYDPVQTFDGNTLYKLDYNMSGRYLSIKITHNDYRYVNLLGFDVDLDVYGER